MQSGGKRPANGRADNFQTRPKPIKGENSRFCWNPLYRTAFYGYTYI